jgi:SRSO17 transposase
VARLDERELEADDIADIEKRLKEFLEPFRKMFVREEQRMHAAMYIEGRTRQLNRRTIEPIAVDRDVNRRPLQHFVGAGKWEDDALREVMAQKIGAEMGRPNGVLILDGSGFEKAGPESVGTQRQWCGRLGKEEQCQVGEFLAYAAGSSVTLVDAELYLPKSWANDAERREKCHVPHSIEFQTGWQLAAKMVERRGKLLPHRWVVGDENYGRPTELRDLFHERAEQYLLEVPAKAKIRLVRGGDWTRADLWAQQLPRSAWETFTVRDGEKGPIVVKAAKVRVYTPRETGNERPEVLLVVRNEREKKAWTYFGSDGRSSLAELVRVGSCRHGIEQALEMAKGDVGLDEYEVRSWIGWHHHMTLTMMALWFLVDEQRWLKKRGWSLPSRRFAEFWPTHSGARGRPRGSRGRSTPNAAETTTRGDAGGSAGHGDRLHRGSTRAHRWIDATNKTLSVQLAQSN